MKKLKIAAQLYTLRDYCKTEEDFAASLKKVADIGYRYVQLSGVVRLPAERTRELLDAAGVQPVATHYGFGEYENDTQGMINFHKIIGCDHAGIGSAPDSPYTDAEVKAFAEKAEVVAKAFKDNGLTFFYHNHHREFVHTEKGKTILETLYEYAPSLDAELDLHWVVAGGGDPCQWIHRLAGRVAVVHFKDFTMVTEGENVWNRRFAPIGEGNMNWPGIIAACKDAGVDYAIVEQDNCYGRDPFDCLKSSFDYMLANGCAQC